MKSILYIIIFANTLLFSCSSSENSQEQTDISKVNPENVQTIQIDVEGMVCEGCENHINGDVMELDGIIESNTSHKTGKCIVKFDQSIVSAEKIIETVKNTGYTVVGHSITDTSKN